MILSWNAKQKIGGASKNYTQFPKCGCLKKAYLESNDFSESGHFKPLVEFLSSINKTGTYLALHVCREVFLTFQLIKK